MSNELPPDFVAWLQTITAKRARTVIDHLLQYGVITTEDLKATYGYTHPPRAIRDVKELGIVLKRFPVKDKQGRTIAAYRFEAPYRMTENKTGGRRNFSKRFKQDLLNHYGARCGICGGQFEPLYLQIDHRIPYEIIGETQDRTPDYFMLICGECNRAKGWSCQHCPNITIKAPATCSSCYWANPNNYNHIALEPIRRLMLVWQGQEINIYEALESNAKVASDNLQTYIKDLLTEHIQKNR